MGDVFPSLFGVDIWEPPRFPVRAKVEWAREWYDLGVCPGCGTDLMDVAGKGDGHNRDGGIFYGDGGRSSAGRCEWTADQLTSLVLIGSGTVGYHPDTDVSNRTPAGETAPSRENTPTQVASLTCHCQGGGQHDT